MDYKTVYTYGDGWYIQRKWYPTIKEWGSEHILYDADGNQRKNVLYSFQRIALHRHHWWHTPHPWACLVMAAFSAVFAVMPGAPLWSRPLNALVAGLWIGTWIRERKKYGSNRRTEEDSRDTEADDGTEKDSGTGAAPGAGQSPGVSVNYNIGPGRASVLNPPAEFSPPPLETVEDDMPILAHRWARIVPTATGLTFASVAQNQTFEVDADAKCANYDRRQITAMMRSYWSTTTTNPIWSEPTTHEAPAVSCSCGFYAVPADKLGEHEYNGVALQVELSGRVIEHELGYRAEHQRVIQVTAPPCPGCGGKATRAWRHASEGKEGCRDLVWDCGQHDVLYGGGLLMAMTLDQMSYLLGVPVVNG